MTRKALEIGDQVVGVIEHGSGQATVYFNPPMPDSMYAVIVTAKTKNSVELLRVPLSAKSKKGT